jgi:hypothetical protein
MPIPTCSNVHFVDSFVTNYESIIAGLPKDDEVYVLNSDQSGLEQIAAYLDGQSDIGAISIFSHGSAGQLLLAGKAVTSLDLIDNSQLLADIGQALSDEGDILLYGCNVGFGKSGEQFIESLAQLTGADVAASDDVTANAENGGDWKLEQQTGLIESQAIEHISGFNEDLAVASGALVLSDLDGDTVNFQLGTTTRFKIDADTAATITETIDDNFEGGDLQINNTSDLSVAWGDFSIDGSIVLSGDDAVFANGESVTVDSTTIGTVINTNDGQAGGSLQIQFNENATSALVSSLLQNIYYLEDPTVTGSADRTYEVIFREDLNSSDTVSGIVTFSGVSPSITNATYNSDNGLLTITGINFVAQDGNNNDIDVSLITISGGDGGSSYQLTTASDVDITSGTEFVVTLTGADKTQVDAILDATGTQSSSGTTYNISVADDWMLGAATGVDIADTSNNGINVVVSPNTPSISLANDTGSSNSDNITNDATMNVAGLGTGNTWEYSLDGTNWLDGTDTSFVLDEGTYAADAVLVRQTDVAGNESTSGTNTHAMTIDTTITDVESVFGWSIREGSDNGTAVGTIDIVDDTLDTTLTYSLTEDAGGLFAIDADTGVISVAGALDYATSQQHQVTAKATDIAGNESEGYYWISVQKAATNNGGSGDDLVDGVEVKTETVTENGEEVEIVTVDPVSGDRQDTDGTSNSADIPLHHDDEGEPVTTISLPEGVGFSSYGNDSARENNGVSDLIGMINDVASIREVNSMTSGTRSFLSLLVADSSELWANEITLTTNSDTPPSEPITIQGNSNGNGIEALVIDASNLPPGTVLDLSDVEFAVVIGPATLTGGGGSNLVYAGEGSQTIILGEDDDELHGGDGDDTVGSEGGDDLLFGDAGNDTLFGGEGMDTLHGGSDTDLVTYEGNKDDYLIEQENGVLTITRKDDATDSDTLINVEQVQFSDQTMAIEYDQDNSILATLYGQILGRQADVSGFQWWANEGDSGTAAGRMVLCMLDSEEYRESHDDFDFLAQTQEQQIATLYEYKKMNHIIGKTRGRR